MKNFNILILLCVVFIFESCQKNNGNGTNYLSENLLHNINALDTIYKYPGNDTTLLGIWNIRTDSNYVGVGVNNYSVNYAGQPGDYFNFVSNNLVYTKEGKVLDTLTYTLNSVSSVIISSFGIIANGVPEKSIISNFATHTVTIQAPIAITPAGIFGRKVELYR